MNPARIAELLEPFLGSDQHQEPNRLISSISTYIDMLLRWNARVNLTAIRDPEEIVTRHFGESLFAARHLFPCRTNAEADAVPVEQHSAVMTNQRVRLADVGSGAGFPGIPIKLWAPHISLTLIESNHKKSTFLREVTRALTLTDVDIQNVRAETVAPSSFDVVTLRAVERFETILPVAAALVAPTGRLAILIGAAQLQQAQSVLPDHQWSQPAAVPSSRSRILVMARHLTRSVARHGESS